MLWRHWYNINSHKWQSSIMMHIKNFIPIFILHALIIQKSQTHCFKKGISKQVHGAYGSAAWYFADPKTRLKIVNGNRVD